MLDNHLLQRTGCSSFKFTHELYHDYFAAADLESQEESEAGSGIAFALARFATPEWEECIRLFAGLSGTENPLIDQGAEKNPFLAWRLLRDASLTSPELVKKVADEAYCALSAQLTTPAKADLAGSCILVLADLERHDLLKLAITEQRQTFESAHRTGLSEEERNLAVEKQNRTVLPLANGLLLLVRLGMAEQQAGKEDRFCEASRVGLHALRQIEAAGVLAVILSSWTAEAFDPSRLVPGVVLETLIDLGVDEVLEYMHGKLSRSLVEWLALACEAGWQKAWPAYGRVLRLSSRAYYADCGIEFDPAAALKWLRKAHDSGDAKGSLELALLIIEEPDLQDEPGDGERLLRKLATDDMGEAKFELGKRLLNGDGLPKAEQEGFRILIEAAETGHSKAFQSGLMGNGIKWGWCWPELPQELPDGPHLVPALVPDWAAEFKDRWVALLLKLAEKSKA